MSEKYIVEGPALAKLLQENRIRVVRGDLKFTPLTIGDDKREAPVEDSKAVDPASDTKTPKKSKK